MAPALERIRGLSPLRFNDGESGSAGGGIEKILPGGLLQGPRIRRLRCGQTRATKNAPQPSARGATPRMARRAPAGNRLRLRLFSGVDKKGITGFGWCGGFFGRCGGVAVAR